MALRPQILRLLARPATSTPRPNVCVHCRIRCSSTTTTAPSPTLSRLREDLKTAMRAKDTVRLGVLRAVLADITNASKTSSPITDDLSLLALLRKKISQTQASIEEFYQADRKDLVAKEKAQLDILNEYVGGVKVMGRDEVKDVVLQTIAEIKSEGRQLALGDVMKRVTGPGGKLEGKMVEKSTVVSVIREEIGVKK
ncbi:uncharacterized protein PV09_03190 [Verruconis gallopava]|uniref:Altered inheritance of mitochondria protein 41 n=1 Tax=Verruconis gallopava TaxID=253628 RepID=A0A0D2B489_9PEZI|nr:uncharacterized protein PV09_03190 [Verruconis gallopava]KIW06009.1 hypothetical protein PV09_03190 [Verruconis gallopava]